MANLWKNYTLNNPFGNRCAEGTRKYFEMAVDSISLEDSRPIYIGDYGTADGGANLDLLVGAIETLKIKHGSEQSIVLVFEDLSSTDFGILFQKLEADSRMSKFSNVFPLACGKDFFRQCMPAGTMDIIINTVALHWLSKTPCELENTLTIVTSNNLTEQEAFYKQAENDWIQFLLHRSTEIRKGGYLVVCCHEGKRRYPLYELLDSVWVNMLEQGKITKTEFTKATFQFYHRSMEEYCRPFANENSAVRQSGLTMVDIFKTDLPKPDYGDSLEGQPDGCPDTDITEKYLLDARRWTEKTIRDALDQSRSEDDKADLMEKFYYKINKTVLNDPLRYVEMSSFAFMLIQKEIKH